MKKGSSCILATEKTPLRDFIKGLDNITEAEVQQRVKQHKDSL